MVNGLTGMNLSGRCNEEWQKRLLKVKQKHRVTGAIPYGRTVELCYLTGNAS